MKRLTGKEEIIMEFFWERGEMFVRELRELYQDPKPHINTLSTQVRTLDDEGYLSHHDYGSTYKYFARVSKDDYKKSTLSGVIDKYFGKSYLSAVSSLVQEEKITVEELKELVEMIEKGEQK
ncbi:MAG: BlaI/MecI/CopY family transcriptional regulator [Prevotella sp.]|nr:BlaI/MecI/CopY family transcriptional regulator [Prevotella sp.]